MAGGRPFVRPPVHPPVEDVEAPTAPRTERELRGKMVQLHLFMVETGFTYVNETAPNRTDGQRLEILFPGPKTTGGWVQITDREVRVQGRTTVGSRSREGNVSDSYTSLQVLEKTHYKVNFNYSSFTVQYRSLPLSIKKLIQ